MRWRPRTYTGYLIAGWLLFSLALFGLQHRAVMHSAPAAAKGVKGLVSKTWLTLTLRPQIPHIMHQIFLAGAVKYRRQTLTGRIKESYRKSCLEKHAHWEHHFWARSEAEDLVKQDFPWFWHTWTGYKEWVKQGDVLRYMLLYKYGGMYLDMDVECFAAADDSLGDYTIVLQGTGIEGVTNAVMASAPNNTFWLEVLRTCQERADKPEFKIAIQATGPKAVGATIKRLFDVDPFHNIGFVGKDLELKETRTRIKTYRQGEWFAPCWFQDKICWRRFNAGVAAGTWDMEGLVGVHRFTGTWNPWH